MAMAFSQQSFLTSTQIALPPHRRGKLQPPPLLRCRASTEKDADQPRSFQLRQITKLAVVVAAAGVLALGSVDAAEAAKSGGRVGGQAFRSSAPSAPRINRSRTNIYINPQVAPPLVGGYGYGSPYYGGWGWSPFSFFAPGPAVAVGVGGFDFLLPFLILGAIAGVLRSFSRRRDDDDDDF